MFIFSKRWLESWKLFRKKITSLYPQSNGMLEKFNCTILNNLSLLVSRKSARLEFEVSIIPASILQCCPWDYWIYSITVAVWLWTSSFLWSFLLSSAAYAFIARGVPSRSPSTVWRRSQFCSGMNQLGDRKDEDEVWHQSDEILIPQRRESVAVEPGST